MILVGITIWRLTRNTVHASTQLYEYFIIMWQSHPFTHCSGSWVQEPHSILYPTTAMKFSHTWLTRDIAKSCNKNNYFFPLTTEKGLFIWQNLILGSHSLYQTTRLYDYRSGDHKLFSSYKSGGYKDHVGTSKEKKQSNIYLIQTKVLNLYEISVPHMLGCIYITWRLYYNADSHSVVLRSGSNKVLAGCLMFLLLQ